MRTDRDSTTRSRARQVGIAALCLTLAVQAAALYWPSVSVTGPVSWTDTVVHAVIFAVPTLLVVVLFPGRLWPVALIALHAPVSELIQHFLLPHRSGDPLDAVADLGGVVAGLGLGWWASRSRWSGSYPRS